MFATTGALAPQRSVLQHPANRGMSLATCEQKAVVTNFYAGRAFFDYFFTREKVMIASSSFGNNLQLKVENCIRI